MLKNFLLYNIGWLACVWFAAQGQPWIGVLAVVLIVAAHLVATGERQREVRTLLTALLIGLTWETLLVAAGLVAYPTAPGIGTLAPLWMIALWANFACTIHHSLGWIRQRPWLAAALGAIGGPLAFVAGEKLGAVVFPNPAQALAVIAVGWAVLLPLLVSVSTPRRTSIA